MPDQEMIQDLSTESLVIGYIFNNQEIISEYINLISPTYDFSDESLRFLYNLLVLTYSNNSIINEISINVEVAKLSEEEQQKYKDLNGFNVFLRLGKIAQVQNDFKKLYEKLKTFNVIRDLDSKGFAIQNNLDKIKDKTVDQILKMYELQLTKVSSYIKGISDGIRVGDDIIDYYNQLKETPDEGISLPFKIISHYIRGWRLGTIGGLGLNSGFGKTRTTVRILVHTSVIGNKGVVVIANEQSINEFKSMILTCVANVLYSKEYGFEVNEDDINRGKLTGKEDEMVMRAAEYIKEHSKIIFYETSIFDLDSLKMIMRKYQLREKISHFVIDTFKPYHNPNDRSNSQEWQQYTQTVEQLKDFARLLKIGIFFTFQLTDETLKSGELNSNSISNGKHIFHHMDYVIIGRQLNYKEKEKWQIKILMPDNPFCGELQGFDQKCDYFILKIAKNRAGKSGKTIVLKVNCGTMLFEEMGVLVKVSDDIDKSA